MGCPNCGYDILSRCCLDCGHGVSESEIGKCRIRFDALRNNLQTQLRNKEAELNRVRNELTELTNDFQELSIKHEEL